MISSLSAQNIKLFKYPYLGQPMDYESGTVLHDVNSALAFSNIDKINVAYISEEKNNETFIYERKYLKGLLVDEKVRYMKNMKKNLLMTKAKIYCIRLMI